MAILDVFVGLTMLVLAAMLVAEAVGLKPPG
jgi:hypothetical protein